MFTGIAAGAYPVVELSTAGGVLRYQVELEAELLAGLVRGASVAIDGVCQTVVAIEGQRVAFEAVAETLRRTTLGALERGQRVNIERSLRAGDEIGGHEVAGHVTGTGELLEVRRGEGVHDLRVAVPAAWMKYIFEKGFIAVDGASLTVGRTDPSGSFELHLIPETLRLTRLGDKAVGDRVNVELDAKTVAIVDTVERVLPQIQGAGR